MIKLYTDYDIINAVNTRLSGHNITLLDFSIESETFDIFYDEVLYNEEYVLYLVGNLLKFYIEKQKEFFNTNPFFRSAVLSNSLRQN